MNKEKLESLAKEYNATMAHAEEVLNEYLDVAIEQTIVKVLSELSDIDRIIIIHWAIKKMLTAASPNSIMGVLVSAVKENIKKKIEEEDQIIRYIRFLTEIYGK